MKRWNQRRDADKETGRRAHQIKEIVRLGATLRADMGLEDILHMLVTSIHRTIGFHVAALNLVQHQQDELAVVATAGLTAEQERELIASRPQLSRLKAAMIDRLKISNSYFIPHQYRYLLDGAGGVTVPTPPLQAPDAWHTEDVLLVPLLSPHDGSMLGILSLDQPEDGRQPSQETIELIEIFANQAALAIQNSRLYHERERERQVLELGLQQVLEVLHHVRQGDLTARSSVQGSLLSALSESLNVVLTTLGSLLAEVREAGQIVDHNAAQTRQAATQLAITAQEQARQILDVSGEIEALAANIQRVAGTATTTSATAIEAIEISTAGRDFAEQAALGMQQVRGMVLQAAKKIQRLGEHTQEIGQIVQTVSDFASRTNLLALNAAIEAARAGDSNGTFGVFAKDIRQLANNSDDAAKQIAARISAIQQETTSVVASIEESTEHVVRQAELALQAGAALEATDLATQRVASAIHVMTASATQQAQTARTISSAMADIAQISAATRDRMEEMRAAMDDLVERAISLLHNMRYFQLPPAGGASPQSEGFAALPPGQTPPSDLAPVQRSPHPPYLGQLPGATPPFAAPMGDVGTALPLSLMPEPLYQARPTGPLGAPPRLTALHPTPPEQHEPPWREPAARSDPDAAQARAANMPGEQPPPERPAASDPDTVQVTARATQTDATEDAAPGTP